MTIREAAEVLYDEYTGTKGRLGNSTQETRWIAFTERVVGVAGQGVIDREALIDAIDLALALSLTRETNAVHDIADAVLAVLPGRTVAQVKAEAWDEGATAASPHGGAYLRSILISNPYLADEIEREDKR